MNDLEHKPVRLTDEEKKRQRQRNIALAWVLVAMVTLFFIVTIARLGGNVANRMI